MCAELLDFNLIFLDGKIIFCPIINVCAIDRIEIEFNLVETVGQPRSSPPPFPSFVHQLAFLVRDEVTYGHRKLHIPSPSWKRCKSIDLNSPGLVEYVWREQRCQCIGVNRKRNEVFDEKVRTKWRTKGNEAREKKSMRDRWTCYRFYSVTYIAHRIRDHGTARHDTARNGIV